MVMIINDLSKGPRWFFVPNLVVMLVDLPGGIGSLFHSGCVQLHVEAI